MSNNKFKMVQKSFRGGRGAPKNALIRVKKVKNGISFTFYKDFADLTGIKDGSFLQVGVDGKRIALIKTHSDEIGYSVAINGKESTGSYRLHVRDDASLSFVSGIAIYFTIDQITEEDGMYILNYGKAFFESKSVTPKPKGGLYD